MFQDKHHKFHYIKFYDYLTDSYYGNYVDSIDYDIDKTFGEVTTISEIKSQFQTKSLIVAFRKFLKDSFKSVKMVDILDENIEEINKIVNIHSSGQKLEGEDYTNGNFNKEV